MSVAEIITPLKTEQITQDADEQPALARRFLRYLVLMREIEDRIERKLYRQGKILGGVYVGRGQEAIPVGSSLLARRTMCCFPPTAIWPCS